MLPNPDLKIVTYALSTLHNLIRHLGKQAKQAVRLCGGVERMVELFDRKMTDKMAAKFQPTLFDSLHCMAFHSIETKGLILSMGGTKKLLGIINTAKMDKTLLTGVKLLKGTDF